MTREVMQQALEALLDLSIMDTYQNEDDEVGCKVCCGEVSYRPHSPDCKTMQAITALRRELEKPADEPVPKGVTSTTITTTYFQPARERVVFPTMLRKMWSGTEVQQWLDENVNKEKNKGSAL